jgi:hypothetical protein
MEGRGTAVAITIELPADVEARIVANALRRGVSPNEYAGQLVADAVPLDSAMQDPKGAPEGFRERMAALGKLAGRDLPSIPDEALRRENLYEREDEML